MNKALDFAALNYDRFLSELIEFCKIPSVSADKNRISDMKTCAKWISDALKGVGFQHVHINETKGHPIITGEIKATKGAPTILIYGHYDVQPEDPIELWQTPPFSPVIKNEKIYCRGSSDDKGQLFIHLKAIESWMKAEGSLPVGVKVLFEGEEEIGSANLQPFIKINHKQLAADCVLVSDTGMYAPGLPTITYGLRGICYVQVDMKAAATDLHSGSYGGAVANPCNILATLIASAKDKNQKIRIPGFYDDVIPVTAKESKNIAGLKYNEKNFLKSIGAPEVYGEKGYTTLERLWCRPTFEVNGIWGGYTGEGSKTVLPSEAHAKISMRLVPNQNPEKIAKQFKKFIETNAPKSVTMKMTGLHGGFPFLTPLDNPFLSAAGKSLKDAFKTKNVAFIREGGSIPIVVDFANILKAPVVLMGFGLATDMAHAPNENFDLKNFRSGIDAVIRFFQEASGLKKK